MFKLIPLNEETKESEVKSEGISVSYFLSLIPKPNRVVAAKVVKYLGEEFSVTTAGEVKFGSATISGSRAHDLLVFVTSRRVSLKNIPAGLQDFLEILKQQNVPAHLLSSRAVKMMKSRKHGKH